MRIWKLLLYALDRWVAEVVVVVMTDDYKVNDWQVLDLAWWRREALQALDRDGRAAVLEDWVEEDAQTTGEFDIVARVAEPCGA